MRAADFTKNRTGRLVPTDGGLVAFVPDPLPPKLAYTDDVLNAVAVASSACSSLSVAATQLESDLMVSGIIRSFLRKEATLSSRIEGTHTTLMNLLLFEQEDQLSAEAADSDTAEVLNYIAAQEEGLSRLARQPITLRMLRELHRVLLQGVRGRGKSPGHFRRDQVHLGASYSAPAEARYVPPPWRELADNLDNFEKFINAEDRMHPLLRISIAHYQFEAIHPFSDGNGRIGRLLIILMMCALNVVERPLVYPSAYLESRREEYYDRLLRVSTHGDWNGWVLFFLQGIALQAREALERCRSLMRLHDKYTAKFQHGNQPARLLKLIDLLFQHQSVSAAYVQQQLDCSKQTAQTYIQRLVSEGILVQLDERQRNRRFYAKELFEIIDA